ncbi:hypothetical protein Tco_0769006 [Tanacetum coccineum]|uniref:Uncharacterized protein n=1 Tax=Tanacetum coccineum TaxID=301880 RepID=A0ABQ4Z8D3_9ASTR
MAGVRYEREAAGSERETEMGRVGEWGGWALYFINTFLRLAKGIVDFGNGILTIYPDTTIFDDDSSDNLENIFANVDVTDLLPLEITHIPRFVCNMVKNAIIKRKPSKNCKMSYDSEGPSLTVNRVLTREELSMEELEKDLWERIIILSKKGQ